MGKLFYFVVFLILMFLFGRYFIQNISFLFGTNALASLIRGQWWIVGFYIVLFSAFVFFLKTHPVKKVEWKRHSVYIAFIVALFAEMFGFPLSLYFLSSLVPPGPSSPALAFTFEFAGTRFNLLLTSLVASVVTLAGIVAIVKGWKEVYRAESLVTRGLYRHVRHPQYLGIMLITTAWLLAWPTLPILVMWPILVLSYYKLAKAEERQLERAYGEGFLEYKKKVPMFLPWSNL